MIGAAARWQPICACSNSRTSAGGTAKWTTRMDIKREGVARQKRIKYTVYSVLMVAALGSATYYISKLKPAAPSVEWATIWPGTVKRGSMLVDVKGTGTLKPQDIVFIPAAFDSQVSKINVNSGDRVKPDTVLMVL